MKHFPKKYPFVIRFEIKKKLNWKDGNLENNLTLTNFVTYKFSDKKYVYTDYVAITSIKNGPSSRINMLELTLKNKQNNMS